jgi:hypothetical protein
MQPNLHFGSYSSRFAIVFKLELQLSQATDAQVPHCCICVVLRAVFQQIGVGLHRKRQNSRKHSARKATYVQAPILIKINECA